MNKKIAMLFIALYPIMPDYFRIIGLPSGSVLAILYVVLVSLSFTRTGAFKIKVRDAVLVLSVVILTCLPYIVHNEYTTAIKTIVEYALVFICLKKALNTKEDVERAIDIIIVVATISCLFGVFEFLFGISLFTPFYSGVSTDLSPVLSMRGAFARSETTFGHAIIYAIYLGICAILDSAKIMKTNKRKYRIFYVVLVITLFTTLSRAPIILFVICQLITVYLFGFKKVIKTVIKVMIGISIVTFIIAIVSPSLFSNIQYVTNIVLAIFSESAALQVGDISNANPFIYRLELLKIIPQYIRDSFWFGRGASLSFTFHMLGHVYSSIDNAFLVWLFKYGVFGLIGNVVFILYLFVVSVKRMKKVTELRPIFTISLFYILNLFSVAQMAEYKLWIIIVVIGSSLAELAGREVQGE